MPRWCCYLPGGFCYPVYCYMPISAGGLARILCFWSSPETKMGNPHSDNGPLVWFFFVMSFLNSVPTSSTSECLRSFQDAVISQKPLWVRMVQKLGEKKVCCTQGSSIRVMGLLESCEVLVWSGDLCRAGMNLAVADAISDFTSWAFGLERDLNYMLLLLCWKSGLSVGRLPHAESPLMTIFLFQVILEMKSVVEQRLGFKSIANTPEPVEQDAGEVGAGSLPDRTPTPTSTEVRHCVCVRGGGEIQTRNLQLHFRIDHCFKELVVVYVFCKCGDVRVHSDQDSHVPASCFPLRSLQSLSWSTEGKFVSSFCWICFFRSFLSVAVTWVSYNLQNMLMMGKRGRLQ